MRSFGVRLLVLLWCGMAARAELPTVWNVRTAPVTNALNGVGFCQGIFLGVGDGATILTSPEGINWTARPAGTNTAPLFCAAYRNERYVVAGGEEHAVILASTNGVDWFNAPVPPSAGPIYGIDYQYGRFVAVGGLGAEANTSCILASSNGLDWAAQAVPTGYALYEVSPPASDDGPGWADYLYVAVGDHGTIVTSSNGLDWVLRDSGTIAPLRSVAWQGGLLAGGGSGVVLSSSDGFSWTPAAPAPMDVRGLATSFASSAVVAVGNYTTSGRIHASVDGLTWPGNPLLFPQPLNAVTYGGNSFVAVGNGGLILQAVLGTLAVTNEWTKATSGQWQEPYWSLGVLPSAEQRTVAFRNPGWKALAISANTRLNYPDSLTVNNLIVDAPDDSANQLLLNWAGLDVPLNVLSNLTIGTNGSLASHYSALRAANAYIDGEASFTDYATEDFGRIWLRSGATLGLTNGIMTSSNLVFYYGTFTQSGGSHLAQNVSMVAPPSMFEMGYGTYHLQGGAFGSKTLRLGDVRRPFATDGYGLVVQTGGVHTNSTIYLRGYYSPHGSFPVGAYVLEGGLLVTDLVSSDGGLYSQSGGTNMVQRFDFTGGAGFRLTGGDLITSNTVIYVDTYVGGICIQTGGRQIVRDRLLVRGRGYDYTDFHIEGGSVVASNLQISGNIRIHSNAVCSTSRIDMDSGARLYVYAHGIVSNTGTIAIAGRVDPGLYTRPDVRFETTTETQHLGRLQVLSGALLDFNGAAPVRFADGHTVDWTGRLLIRFPGPGSDTHVFFGTNALGLSPAQLAQTEFQNGFNGMKYAAMLLPTGELVPVAATNSWTKGGSGYWEEPYWSLGRLPGAGEALVLIDNAGSKTVTIGRDTAATYPQSLSLSKLMIGGPAGTLNQLALDSAGLDVPLRLRWDLTVGTNGSLVSGSSALQIPTTYIDGSAWLSNGSLANLEKLWISSGAEMNLTGASRMNSSNLTLSGGTFTQSGGTLAADYVNLSGPFSATMTPSSTFVLRDGVLTSRDMDLDSPSNPVGSGRWAATLFWQFAGIHTNSHMELWGSQNANGGTAAGTYRLDGGLLVSESVAGYAGVFIQRGGTHIVQSSLQIGYLPYDGSAGGGYELSGGALRTASLSLAKAELRLSAVGSVSNAGWLTLAMGAGVVADGTSKTQYLGKLQVHSASYLDLHSGPPTNATLFRFGDSRTLAWFGSLQIRHWGLNYGDHVFFGTNAQALTAEQLARISFAVSNTNYPAVLLATGELVPGVPPPLAFTKTASSLILSWPGPYELLTATNAPGPYRLVSGATSPVTNTFSDHERYFRLRMPVQ